MRVPAAVEVDPVADHAAGVLPAFEAMAERAPLLKRPDDPLDHAVLQRAMRGNELLPQSVAALLSGCSHD